MRQLRGGNRPFPSRVFRSLGHAAGASTGRGTHHRPNQVAVDGAQLAGAALICGQKDHRMKAYIRFHQRK